GGCGVRLGGLAGRRGAENHVPDETADRRGTAPGGGRSPGPRWLPRPTKPERGAARGPGGRAPPRAGGAPPPRAPDPAGGPHGEGIGTRRMAGTVVDAAGNAVADADVWMITNGVTGKIEVFTRTKTDAQGRFEVTIPGRWFAAVHSWRQELGLIAYKAGYRLAALGFSRSAIPPESGTRLVLEAPVESAVEVLAPDGKPVAGARVEVAYLACEEIWTDITEQRARDIAAQFKFE